MAIISIIFSTLCTISTVLVLLFFQPTKTVSFYDRNGQFLGTTRPIYGGIQIYSKVDEIPSSLKNKLISNEDRFFYFHQGVNPFSVARAFLNACRTGRLSGGGSTITQQYAKNLIQLSTGVSQKRTFSNKLLETLLSVGLESVMPKKDILEGYFNTIYFGQRCYGVAAAAKCYFNKNLANLSEAEISFISSLPKSPGKAAAERKFGVNDVYGRHFVEFVEKNLGTGVKTVDTTLDLEIQKNLETIIKNVSEEKKILDPKINVAAVVLDVGSGDILAMAGSRDYFDDEISGKFNSALALRQPGSALKPFTYLGSFAKGYSPKTVIEDLPSSYYAKGEDDSPAYIPQNFDRKYHGAVSVRSALGNSYNVPAVATLNRIGLSFYHELLRKFGIKSFNKSPQYYGLAITLGAGEVSLLDLTNAYAALARGGYFLPYHFLKDQKTVVPVSIVDNSAEISSEISDILSDQYARVAAFGFNDNLMIEDQVVAVKTGTSYQHKDNWTIGYTPKYVVGVWVGHSDGTKMDGLTGATGAAPFWHAIMESLLRKSDSTSTYAFNDFHNPEQKPVLEDWSGDFKIVSPLPNSRYRISRATPLAHQKILASVGEIPKQKLQWFLNEALVQETDQNNPKIWIDLNPGRNCLKVVSEKGTRSYVYFNVTEEDE